MTSAVSGFSFALSGMMMEPTFFSSSSSRFTTMLSLIGVIFIFSDFLLSDLETKKPARDVIAVTGYPLIGI